MVLLRELAACAALEWIPTFSELCGEVLVSLPNVAMTSVPIGLFMIHSRTRSTPNGDESCDRTCRDRCYAQERA